MIISIILLYIIGMMVFYFGNLILIAQEDPVIEKTVMQNLVMATLFWPISFFVFVYVLYFSKE